MKKVLKIIAPGVLMFILIYLMRGGKDILEGLYFIFPIIYIVIGMFNYESKMEWLLSILVTFIAFIIPINIFFIWEVV